MPTPADRPAALTVWRDEAPRPGWANMAVDRALLGFAAREGAIVLRLYAWQPHCLSFGRHEPAARRYDRHRIERLGLDCVRRPTGGRAVWHARELTYAVVAPESALGGLREAYRTIHEWLAEAVRRLGAPADLARSEGRPPDPAAGACFAVPVGGEVVAAGAKVVGSAQLREGGAILQHGSMLLEDDQSQLRALATIPDPRPSAERPLTALIGRPVSWREAADAVTAVLPDAGFAVESADLTPRLLPLAAEWESHFRDPEWTWER